MAIIASLVALAINVQQQTSSYPGVQLILGNNQNDRSKPPPTKAGGSEGRQKERNASKIAMLREDLLHHAAGGGDLKQVKSLLRSGVGANAKDLVSFLFLCVF